MTLTTLQLSNPEGSREVCYQDVGSGEPLVLIHGVGMRSASWGPQIEHFAKSHRVIALNMPGHGGSTALKVGAQLPDFVAWLHDVLTALKLGPVNLAGHSMGALVSGGYVASHPENVRRVALLNGVHRRTKDARAAVVARASQIADGDMDIEGPLSRWFGDSEADKQARSKVKDWLQGVDQTGYAITYNAFAHGDDIYADHWVRIACPALFLTGDGDPNSTAAMAKTMADAAKDGKACVIEGHKHMVNLTAPDIVNAAMQSWLQEPVAGSDKRETKTVTIDNPRALRDAFGAFLTGVTVVTAHDSEGKPLGFTANSFSSVSLDPPLLLVCLAKTSSNYENMTKASGFAVNVLAEDQKDVSNTFASRVEDRFACVSWKKGPNGAPVFDGTAAWFDCSMHNVVDAGDHAILIGEVKAFENGAAGGLGYARGAYFTPTLEAQAMRANTNVVVSAIIEHEGNVLLVKDEDDQLTLPSRRVTAGAPSENLTQLLETTSPSAAIGFVYSVFENAEQKAQHMAYHCRAADGESALGSYYPLNEDTIALIPDSATQTMLRRLEQESRMGNYGIYFGNQESGEVRQIS
jgi:flavin reductase (DIM6/NTAB) family NADH-FMN oxidoreductase RutF/pimeloyl-ACP methyl ester carboxylesterase